MSLLHRTQSIEGFRRSSKSNATTPGGSDGSRTPAQLSDPPRRLSYNPVGEWVPPAAKQQPVGAYEVGRNRRLAQVGVAALYCLFSAGVVFGYAALKPVLISEGVYRDQCTKEELEDGVRVCYKQELRLNLMFTIAAVATNICALPVGTLLDRFGPQITSIIGCFFMIAGLVFLGFASDMAKANAEGYIPGYLFLALGGPHIFISCFHLSNTFPRYSGLILALVTGAFDTSSVIFLLYRLIYTASDGKFGLQKFFLVYLVFPVLILLAQVFLMPKQSYKTISELVTKAEDPANDVHDSDEERSPTEVSRLRKSRQQQRERLVSEVSALLGPNESEEEDDKREDKTRWISGVWGAMHGKSALQQILSWWFILVTGFTMLQMLRINYFIATIRPQYQYLLQSTSKAAQINGFFDIALPVGGVIAIPFIGLILDNTSTAFVLGLLVTIATIIGILGVLPYLWAAYLNVILFVLYRPLYYTTISDYAAKVFGFVTFGKVYGLIICTSGIFNFVQYGLDSVTYTEFKGDPVPVNIVLMGLVFVVGFFLVLFVWIKSRGMARARLEDEAEQGTERLVPGADPRAREDRHPIDVHGTGQKTTYGTTSSGSAHGNGGSS